MQKRRVKTRTKRSDDDYADGALSSLGDHGAWHGIFQIFQIMENMCHCIIDASFRAQ
jgi:hypothetical protein